MCGAYVSVWSRVCACVRASVGACRCGCAGARVFAGACVCGYV